MKVIRVTSYPKCDVCIAEFPTSEPNEAHYDGPINGLWGYVCEGHKIIVPGLTVKLEKNDT
jgi:hypothetical protein